VGTKTSFSNIMSHWSNRAPTSALMWVTGRGAVATAVALLAFLAVAPLSAETVEKRLDSANRHILNWQMAEAQETLDAIEAEGATTAYWLFTKAHHAFFSGDYKTAMDLADQALANEEDGARKSDYASFHKLVQKSHETTKNYRRHISPDGFFELRVEPGKDEVLVPYAFETLDRAYKAFRKEFGHAPPTPIVVEMYPSAATLADVTFLTEEQIKTSGTIALCKYNRLMFTSPKALAKGYGWRDTLSHELAHLVITQKSNNTVPIWMHEGLAKYNERLWRHDGHLRGQLPSSENYLSEGIKKDELITFEQMHPSMALLPSQEATALAFAEVYTVMEYVHRQKGEGGFSELLTLMREHGDAEVAMEKLMGQDFKRFERSWKAYLKTRPTKAFDKDFVYVEKLEFVGDTKGSDILEIGKKEAEDFVHLGELLQARKRYGAALIEYEKARELIGDRNPLLQKRLGKTLIIMKRYDEAIDVLVRSLEYYPVLHETHSLLGQALHALGREEEAEVHLLEAVSINPFDPTPHRLLAEIYEASGRKELAERSRGHAITCGG
jgi:tetratricopeptide (TPR) repeat protein